MKRIADSKSKHMSVAAEIAAGYIIVYVNANDTETYHYLISDVPNMYMAQITEIKGINIAPIAKILKILISIAISYIFFKFLSIEYFI